MAELFAIVGVQPAIGRTFAADEIRPGSRVAIISHRLWTRRFGGERAILDRPIVAQGIAYSIVGVMPAGYALLDSNVDVWLPFGFTAQTTIPMPLAANSQRGARLKKLRICGSASHSAPSTSPTRTHPPANPAALPSAGPRNAVMTPTMSSTSATRPSVIRFMPSF